MLPKAPFLSFGKTYVSEITFQAEKTNDVLTSEFNIDTLGESKSGNYQIHCKEVKGSLHYGCVVKMNARKTIDPNLELTYLILRLHLTIELFLNL